MRVLIVGSGNVSNFNFKLHQAFIYDQVEAIKKIDGSISFDYFFIKGKGIQGYLLNYKSLIEKIKHNNFDLIHAHVALSGLLANLQRRVPVVTTFHGSDINVKKSRYISYIVEKLSSKSIYVSNKLVSLAIKPGWNNISMIPCGVDFEIFNAKNSGKLKEKWGFDSDKKYILFSSTFDNVVKNFKLLQNALNLINDDNIEIIELNGYSREEVAELMNIVDVCVMTSFTEGSPQFIKEAMACNCAIVSTDVGDVKEMIDGVIGCYIAEYKPNDVADKVLEVIKQGVRTNGNTFLGSYDNRKIAASIIEIYKDIVYD
jgi:glycosyltransferase involved in cell wall biosynthesis